MLFGVATVGVNLPNALIASISHDLSVGMNLGAGFLKQPKIMASAAAKSRGNNLACCGVDHNLTFQRVAFFLPRVKASLFFRGRSIGVSVASTSTTS